mmetsp:Transcript_29881/g.54213  ORF Transcript_29881/g.54213 Transcript_29881/m.54213 type:complete len:160 (-) Transcript_29881:182-661(-)
MPSPMKFAKTLQLAVLVAVATASAAERPDLAPLNVKGGMLRAFNQVAAQHANIQQQDVVCSDIQETCYDENWVVLSCAQIAEGGCPCPEGEVKCGADELIGYTGWCTARVCCDHETEITCYDDNWKSESCAKKNEGCPCPEGELKCDASKISVFYGIVS